MRGRPSIRLAAGVLDGVRFPEKARENAEQPIDHAWQVTLPSIIAEVERRPHDIARLLSFLERRLTGTGGPRPGERHAVEHRRIPATGQRRCATQCNGVVGAPVARIPQSFNSAGANIRPIEKQLLDTGACVVNAERHDEAELGGKKAFQMHRGADADATRGEKTRVLAQLPEVWTFQVSLWITGISGQSPNYKKA